MSFKMKAKRPYLASECDSVQLCETYRQQVLKETCQLEAPDMRPLADYQGHFEERDSDSECWFGGVPDPRPERPHQQVAQGEETLGE